MFIAENMENTISTGLQESRSPLYCPLTQPQGGPLSAAPGSLSKIETGFMKHISNEELPPFCSGNAWQPRFGSAHRERQGNRICRTWTQPTPFTKFVFQNV